MIVADAPKQGDSDRLRVSTTQLAAALGETEILEPICGQIANLAEANHFDLLWGGCGTLRDRGLDSAVQLAEKYIAQGADGVFFDRAHAADWCAGSDFAGGPTA